MIDEPLGEGAKLGEGAASGESAAIETVAEVMGAAEMARPAGTPFAAPYLEPGEAEQEPGQGEPEEQQGSEGGEGTKARPSARFLTISIVLVTFVAALGGLLLNRASAAASNAADIAQELSLQGSAAKTSAYQQAESDYSQYLSLQALKGEAAQEMLEATYDQPDAQTWAEQYKSTSSQVQQTSSLIPSDVQPNLPNGNPDPGFPADFFAKRAQTGTYLGAKSDAYNDVSDRWSRLVDSYAAILTMIAVTLFLFGSAYVLLGRSRLLFFVVGTLLVVTGAVWGGALTAAKEPSTPSSAAAQDYAEGVTALDQVGGLGSYQASIDDFTAAINLRPDYALAYSERAAAEALEGSETIGVGFVSIIAPKWERLVVGDELKAFQLGLHTGGQFLAVGFSYYSLWISKGGVGPAPAVAVYYFQQAAKLDPTDPNAWLDLGISEVATGRYKAAAQAYTAGITNMLFTCTSPGNLATCDEPQPSTTYVLQQAWLAGGMQSLEDLAQSAAGQHSATLRAEATQMEGMLSDSMATGEVTHGPYGARLKVSGLVGDVDPGTLQLNVPLPPGVTRAQMASMPLTVVWYERPAGQSNWVAITATTCWGHGQERCGGYNSTYKYFFFTTYFLADDNACAKNLQYRAEIWAGGVLAGSTAKPFDIVNTNLSPALAKAMDMGICTPSTWHAQPLRRLILPVHGTKATVTGALSSSELSYASPDHKSGVYLFRLYPPRTTPSGAKTSLPDVVQSGESYALSVLKGIGLPSDLAPTSTPYYQDDWPLVPDMTYRFYASPSTNTRVLVGAALIGSVAPDNTAGQDSYISGALQADYAVAVTVVYAPSGTFWAQPGPNRLSLASQIFFSWSLLDFG